MKVYGKLERAQIEHVGALPSASVDKAKGRIVYLTTDDKLYESDGTNWHTIVTNDQSETLTNKTLTAPIMTDPVISSGPLQLAEISTPSTPSSGNMKVYPKSDNFLYSLDDTGAERKVGSGSGADTFYFEDFESGVYSAFTASGSFSLANGARAATAVLDGSKEAKFTRGASSDTISWSVPIPVGYNPSVVRIAFLYETDSSYADNDIEIQVLNGATQLGVVGHQLKAGKGKHICEFQTDAATADTTYTLRFKQATTGSWTNVYIDDLTVAAREIARGSVVTDPVAYTPTFTGFGTVTGVNFESWRDGGVLKIRGTFTTGTPTATEGRITLGFGGVSANVSSKSTLPTISICGKLSGTEYAVDYFGAAALIEASKTYLTFGIQTSTTSEITKSNGSVYGTSKLITLVAEVPIEGWSSNAVISSDFGGRIIAANAYRSGTQTGVNPNASAVKININSKTASGAVGFDTTNSFDVTTNFRYDVPETGYYNVNGAVNVNTTNVLNNTYFALLRVSGSNAAYGESANPEASQYFTASVSSILYLTAGQYVELFLYGVGNNSVSTLTVNASETYLNLYKIQSPQTLISGEKVLCRVHSSSTIVNSTSNVDLIFSTKSYDTHSAYNTSTGVFTSPRSGRLNIDTVFRSSAGVSAVAVGDAAYLYIANTTQSKTYMVQQLNAFTTTSVTRFLQGSIGIDVNSGDQIKIQAARDTNHGNITGGNTEFVTWADFKMEG